MLKRFDNMKLLNNFDDFNFFVKRPMLSIAYESAKKIPKSMYVSEKIDGIRCLSFSGRAYSRNMKLIPNKYIQSCFSKYKAELDYLDGELIVGSDSLDPTLFRKTTSSIMAKEGEPDFTYYVFDIVDTGQCSPWYSRYQQLLDMQDDLPEWCKVLPHFFVKESKEQDNPLALPEVHLDEFEQSMLSRGAEGVILRDTYGNYVQKRVTPTAPYMMKLKRFIDNEFLIVGYEPMYQNTNDAVINEIGLTERSTKKEGLIEKDMLGALTLQTEDGTLFSCGSGFTLADRMSMWKDRDNLIGKKAKVKYFAAGDYSVPRFPVFAGIRSEIDM